MVAGAGHGAAPASARPALTWQGIRATAEATELAARFGDPEPLIGTALPWSVANMPAKLAWHEPDTVRRTWWLLQPKDFIGMALTGSPVSDPWSSKGICLSARGTVTATAARRFGLPAGIPVSVGWSDALTQTLAAGCYGRGSGFVFSGTSAIVGAPAFGAGRGAVRRAEGLFGGPAPLLYGPTQSSGASVAWVARLLGCRPADVPALAARDRAGGGRRLVAGLRALPVRGARAAVELRGTRAAARPGRRARPGRGQCWIRPTPRLVPGPGPGFSSPPLPT